MKYYNDVKAFHDKFGLVTPDSYFHIPTDLYEFRAKFLEEELEEYVEAYKNGNLSDAIDSLIDLAYVTFGAALLHGFKSEIFVDSRNTVTSKLPPKLLDANEHDVLSQSLNISVRLYRHSYVKNNSVGIQEALSFIFSLCVIGSDMMNIDIDRWNLLWDEVQRANMTKERALRSDQSKRGSTYDVIKPPGWTPPKIEELISRMLQGDL